MVWVGVGTQVSVRMFDSVSFVVVDQNMFSLFTTWCLLAPRTFRSYVCFCNVINYPMLSIIGLGPGYREHENPLRQEAPISGGVELTRRNTLPCICSDGVIGGV